METIKNNHIEDTLKESEEKHSKLFEDSNDSIIIDANTGIILDANTLAEELVGIPVKRIKSRKPVETAEDAIICNINGIITDWNKSAEKIFGYLKNEIIGNSIEILIPERSKKKHKEGLERFLKTGESNIIGKTVEISGITKEGIEIPIEITLTSQKIEKEKYLFAAIIRDLTERKKMDTMLSQTERLRSMGMITSGVAHDFNNILAIISGKAQLLRTNYGDHKGLTDELRIICEAAHDGAEIVSRMKKFTKTERDIPGFVTVDIEEILKQAIDFLRPRWMDIARANGVTYDIDISGIKATPTVQGKPSELREIFVNIINNALDAMSTGGTLSFYTWSKDNNVYVSISDMGIGMTEEVKQKIFDPFFTTKMAEGSGLGMSVAYGIMKRHGGKIHVESKVGKGTIFTLSIPITKNMSQQTELPETNQKIKVRNLRILVVDDDENICSILEEFLTGDDHKVQSVNSGEEAIKLLKNEEYDLVLCDLIIPDASGHYVIKTLDKLKKRPKVGLITGWDEEIETKGKEKLKVDFIIRKPFDFSKLTIHINNIFNTEEHIH